jgi:pimeloyl-ACP methyl ester carboxylesterase
MIARYLILLAISMTAPLAGAADAPTGFLTDVTFTDYSPYSRPAELLSRSGSPLLNRQARQMVGRTGVTLREQDIDLAHEKFALYVPPEAPPAGYALLVFVPPWQQASVPRRWQPILNRHGMIFVSAANSGNDLSTIERREPLALLAAYNVMKRYKVDPQKVYIGGFSGGARVAQRTAVGYPDIFHGVLLEAGADTLGDVITLPSTALFHRFQEFTRIVYLTGDHDESNLTTDGASQHSFRDWCVFDIDTETIPGTWHTLADPSSVNQALEALGKHREVDQEQLRACRAKVDAEMNAQLQQVDDLIEAGRAQEARSSLRKIDLRYGGLSGDRAVKLADRLDAIR